MTLTLKRAIRNIASACRLNVVNICVRFLRNPSRVTERKRKKSYGLWPLSMTLTLNTAIRKSTCWSYATSITALPKQEQLTLFSFCFLALDFCRFCLVTRFIHPSHNGQWPPTAKDFYPRFYPLHFYPILILQIISSISLFNVECQTRELLVPFLLCLVWLGP